MSLGRQPALGHFGCEPPCRTRDLLPRAVIEGDDERETVVAAGQIFRLLQQTANIRIEIVAFADDADADIVLVQIGQIVADEAAQQPHQVADFDGGRDQFSELKEKIVRTEMPVAAARTVLRKASTPRRWPSTRGRPRAAAQRPLPSMMMATWRGLSKPSPLPALVTTSPVALKPS